MNRLAHETSPYLLQHQENPIDWYPWGEEAFALAKAHNKPVFLSIGYSSCHWCHVMAHESFEDEEVAEALNRDFVSIKVDREERPDVDEAYMAAVQLASGRGGWPMSVFLTPDRKPFLAGTYFPREGRQGMPGFLDIVLGIASAWKTKQPELLNAAKDFADALEDTLSRDVPSTFGTLDPGALGQVVGVLANEFDRESGGFGKAPKFPPHTAIEFLLAYAEDPTGTVELREAALAMAFATLKKMALGGIHDHVGGGFHRYSTDERWLLPHFEKMLYDNALLLRNYAHAMRLASAVDEAHANLYRRAAVGIVSWLRREMASPEGAFYSALDADSEGEEGKYYVWTAAEAREVLGDSSFANLYRLRDEGNFHDEATGRLTGANIPHLEDDDLGRHEEDLMRLLAKRESRVHPGLDDKVLVSWNGLVIGALAHAGALDDAERAATAVLAAERTLGSLPHQIAKGRATGPAFADDYAYFVSGLLDLYHASADERWLAEAKRIQEAMNERFFDDAKGGFFLTSEDHERLFGRTKPVFDQPLPSANAVAIRNLIRLGDLRRARASLQAFYGWMENAPSATEGLWLAGLEFLRETASEPTEPVAPVTSTAGDVEVRMPNRELVAVDGWATGEIEISIPPGLHINDSTPPANWLVPTRLEIEGARAEVDYPPSRNEQYVGDLRIPFRVRVQGPEMEFGIRVSWQSCTDTECLPPREKAFDVVARSS